MFVIFFSTFISLNAYIDYKKNKVFETTSNTLNKFKEGDKKIYKGKVEYKSPKLLKKADIIIQEYYLNHKP